MERYLFKAKDCNSIWRVGLLIALQGDRCAIEEKDGSKWACDFKTICQCTGLNDNSGELIWENDIINTKYGKAIVTWDKSEWRIKWIDDVVWRRDLHFWATEHSFAVEVIGNKFDNLDLSESETAQAHRKYV